jgi:phosphate transport system substrate-binding protein
MTYTLFRNEDELVAPRVNWSKTAGFSQLLTDRPGRKSWLITAATFLLMRPQQTKPETGPEVLNFFDWA